METVNRAPDGGIIHEMPESTYDFLLKLWARSKGMTSMHVKKMYPDGTVKEETIEV